jgi:protoporphyrinogen/coproporphyrinogen III oxidase
MPRVVIIGGGISGLSTAYYLSKSSIRSVLIERQPRLGGVIRTDRIHDCIVEHGPDSFLSTKSAARELCEELGLGGDLIGSNDHRRITYIWRGGKLVRLPEGMTMMAPGKIGPILSTRLLSWPAKVRACRDYFYRPTGVERDRSVSEFVTDHYGREVLDYIAEPMLAGIYGGDPGRLGVAGVLPMLLKWEARYGSLTRAARAEIHPGREPLFTTLKGGLQTLVDELARRAQPEVVHGEVERIEKGWRIRVDGNWIDADHVVVACRAAGVLPNLFPEIPYNSARVVAVGYRKSDLGMKFDGFGFLIPKIERRSLSAVTWVPNKFNHRAPEDRVILRCFTAGDRADVREELREKLGITAEPLFTVEADWPQSMPQYEVGHAQKTKIIEAMLQDLPGLHVAGNAYYGIGVPDCIGMGRQVAARIAGALSASA